MFVTYKNYPALPDGLVIEVHKSLTHKDLFPQTPGNITYRMFNVTDLLQEWFDLNILPLLDTTNMKVYAQSINDGIKIHKDRGRKKVLNYIIKTGSNTEVHTQLYNEDKQLIDSVIIEALKWHELTVDQFHTVCGITDTRIALTFPIN